jgi:class 3 adenylate cyclase
LGDGVLAQFHSAYDAVQCAIEIQKAARQVLGMQLRIGIHLGDVTNEDNDVFGDGVNVASRIQGITDPGGIYISESIENAIRNRLDIGRKFLGEAELKNVDYPVRVYAIQGEGLPAPGLIRKPKKRGQ